VDHLQKISIEKNGTGIKPPAPRPGTLAVNRIQRFCIQDGPGIRTTVFTQGCSLRCWWCHNPDTIPAWTEKATRIPLDDLYASCARDARYWQRSGGGVTFSGGECLLQAPDLLPLLARFRSEGHHCTLDTAAMVPLRNVQMVAACADLWLWDMKSVEPELYGRHTGGRLEVWRRNLDWVLRETATPVILRLPLINAFNAEEAEWRRMAAFLRLLPRPVCVEIMPGHTVGTALPPGSPSPEVSKFTVEAAQEALSASNMEVKIKW
jgi:pyruvate formate lyase activating enzyme